MFGKKKQAVAGPPAASPAPAAKPRKTGHLSPKETIIDRLERLAPGESITYQVAEMYWAGLGGFAVVDLNPDYPTKGKKWILSIDKIVDGKPAGKPSRLWDTNKPADMAVWILDKDGKLYSSPQRPQAAATPS